MNMKELSDTELIRRTVEEQNNQYFGVLFERYREKVQSKCFSMTKSRSVSDDLVQDIMVKAMEKLYQFKGKASFSTWLYSITYNHCIEYLTRHQRIKYDDWASSLDIPNEVTESEIEGILELKSARLVLLLEMIKPEDKALILLKYQEGFDLKKIMYILSLEGESATKMRINRAKKRLVAFYNQLYASLEEQ